MQIIPVQAVPNQTFNVTVGGQNCTLNIYQKAFGLFMDVLVNSELIIGGVICENLNRIVRSAYLGFVGDFVWIDNQGSTDPYYTGLGSRYSLAYVTPADITSNLITPVASETFIIPPSSAQLTPTTLEAIVLSNNTFPATGGAAPGTVIGAITVETTGPSFSGTITVGGTNGSNFEIVNGSLLLSGTAGVGTYNITLTAIQGGAIGSPLVQAEQIVGTGTSLQITGITLGGNTFTALSGSGTVVGSITVSTVGGSWTGSLSLTGANASDFKVNGSMLELASGSLTHGLYNFNIVATQAGAIGSPFTQAESVTGQLTIKGITLSNGTFTASGSIGTVIGSIAVSTVGGTFAGTLSLTGTNSGLFTISGSNLVLNSSTVSAGTYNINIVATVSGTGVIGSPFTLPVTLSAAAPTVTWNPDETITGMVFTNNDLTVSNTDVSGSYQYQTCLATKAINGNANSKVYWEVSVVAFSEPNSAVSFAGFASTTFLGEVEQYNGWLGENNDGLGWRMGIADGTIVLDNAFTQIATYAEGDVLCIAVDTVNQLVWFRVGDGDWNNNASADPATGTDGYSYSTIDSGTYYPAIQFDTSTVYTGTANFGNSTFTQTVPSGFVGLADA